MLLYPRLVAASWAMVGVAAVVVEVVGSRGGSSEWYVGLVAFLARPVCVCVCRTANRQPRYYRTTAVKGGPLGVAAFALAGVSAMPCQ
jgi:hypothetical protein